VVKKVGVGGIRRDEKLDGEDEPDTRGTAGTISPVTALQSAAVGIITAMQQY
jgi:hypothetical protein